MDTLETLRQAWAGASAFQVSVLIAAGAWLQEELTLAGAGVLSGLGDVSLLTCLVGALAGIVSADNATWVLGRLFGRRVLEWGPVKRFAGGPAGRGRALFASRGAQMVFTSRFIPGSRAVTFLLAGSMGMPWRRFFAASAIAACLWAPLVLLVAYFVGARVLTAFEAIGANPLVAAGASLVVLLVMLRALQTLAARRAIRAARDSAADEA